MRLVDRWNVSSYWSRAWKTSAFLCPASRSDSTTWEASHLENWHPLARRSFGHDQNNTWTRNVKDRPRDLNRIDRKFNELAANPAAFFGAACLAQDLRVNLIIFPRNGMERHWIVTA